MQNTFKIIVDLKKSVPLKTPIVTEGDSVKFEVSVFDDGKVFDLSNSSRCVLLTVKPDGNVTAKNGSVVGTNKIEFNLGYLETGMVGKVKSIIQVYDLEGRVSSFPFSFIVKNDPSNDYVSQSPDTPLLQTIIKDTQNLLNTLTQKSDYAKTQGDYAKTQGDYAKTQGDAASVSANNANTQATNAQNAAQAANTAAANANNAATNANNAANNANTQATNANNAASNANTKATYAQQQGDYAKTQGNFANEKGNYAAQQGDYAKTQGDYAKTQGQYAQQVATDVQNKIGILSTADDVLFQNDRSIFLELDKYKKLRFQQGTATITGVSSNGYFRDNEPFIQVTLTGYAQINAPNYAVVLDVISANGDYGQLIVYDKTQNGFKVKMTGSASNVTFIWTLLNPLVA